MDWTPSYSQHRAFAPNQPPRTGKVFGQTPPNDTTKTPFWYKVPPAPISQAHKIRNPPNPPSLRIASKEVKENFFNKVTSKNPFGDPDRNASGSDKPNYDFAEQKFFPPIPPSEADTYLADALTSFSLRPADDQHPPPQPSSKWGHVYQFVTLLAGLFIWNQVLAEESEMKAVVNLTLLVGIISISIRTLYQRIQVP